MQRRQIAVICSAPVALFMTFQPACAAPCGDDITALERKLNKEGASAGAAQSSGQKDAAVRSSKADEAKTTGTSVADLQKPPTPENMAGANQAAAAGTSGEDVMAAKVSLNDARNADRKGDDAGCRAAYTKAKQQSRM